MRIIGSPISIFKRAIIKANLLIYASWRKYKSFEILGHIYRKLRPVRVFTLTLAPCRLSASCSAHSLRQFTYRVLEGRDSGEAGLGLQGEGIAGWQGEGGRETERQGEGEVGRQGDRKIGRQGDRVTERLEGRINIKNVKYFFSNAHTVTLIIKPHHITSWSWGQNKTSTSFPNLWKESLKTTNI